MSRIVCFIDDDGQVATCINPDYGNCENCPHDPEAHFNWLAKERINQSNIEKNQKFYAFLGALENAYLKGKSVTLVMPDGSLTIDHSAIPDVREMMVEIPPLQEKKKRLNVPFEFESMSEDEYCRMIRGWEEAKQRNREARYRYRDRSFYGFGGVYIHNTPGHRGHKHERR